MKIVTMLLLICLTSSAKAALISLDDSVFGPNSITRDSVSQLEWLDVYLTRGRSINDLTGVDGTNEFGFGGDFGGFRLASEDEVLDLFESNGVFRQSLTNPTTSADATALVDLLGGPNYPNCCIMAGTSTPGPYWGFSHPLIHNGYPHPEAAGYNLANPKRPGETRYGAYLVRSVPVPPAIILFATGLIALGLRRKYQSSV